MGVIEGNRPASDNDWETISGGGDAAIRKWIGEQMSGRTCSVVLVGTHTSGRKWINYEIEKTWDDGKGLVGIHIHNLQDRDGNQSSKGSNPFWNILKDGHRLSSIVQCYDPPYTRSTNVYDHIKQNIEQWIEEAITIRKSY